MYKKYYFAKICVEAHFFHVEMQMLVIGQQLGFLWKTLIVLGQNRVLFVTLFSSEQHRREELLGIGEHQFMCQTFIDNVHIINIVFQMISLITCAHEALLFCSLSNFSRCNQGRNTGSNQRRQQSRLRGSLVICIRSFTFFLQNITFSLA